MHQDEGIRLRALRAVIRSDRAFFLRRVMRWYSKTFFMPLDQVEEIPIEDLLQVWYEEQYIGMTPEELEDERKELLTTAEQRYEQILAEEADDAEMFEAAQIIAAEEKRKKLEAAKVKTGKITEAQKPLGPIKPVEMPETDLPRVTTTIPPDIAMTFVDEAEFDAELDSFGLPSKP
jgi:hypothetical protein